jgi:hypothetical protein
MSNKQAKPRVQFCWACGGALRGGHCEVLVGTDGHPRTVHERCVQDALLTLELLGPTVVPTSFQRT